MGRINGVHGSQIYEPSSDKFLSQTYHHKYLQAQMVKNFTIRGQTSLHDDDKGTYASFIQPIILYFFGKFMGVQLKLYYLGNRWHHGKDNECETSSLV